MILDNNSLIAAIEENNLEEVRTILVEQPTLVSKEALFCASRQGNLEILRYLVEYSRIKRANELIRLHAFCTIKRMEVR